MRIISHILEDGWSVAVRNTVTGKILEDQTTPFYIIPSTWRTWEADPFVFCKDGEVFIFAEMFDYLRRKGSIGYTKFADGKWTKWKIAIDENFHMSYPNVFEKNGKIYMIPETSAAEELRLYEATHFPETWTLKKTILKDVKWVDTTLIECEDKCFAITTDVTKQEQKDILLELDDEFEILNSVIISESDTNRSRQGGNFFTTNDLEYRVTQDCSKSYGGALLFSIFELNETQKNGMGKIVCHLSGQHLSFNKKQNWIGLHTYNSSDEWEVVDVEKRHFNMLGIFSRLVGKVWK